MSKAVANWKKLRRSSSSYEEGQGVCLGTKASIKEEEQEEIQLKDNHSDLQEVLTALLITQFPDASTYLKIHEFIQNSDFCCVIWPFFCTSKCFTANQFPCFLLALTEVSILSFRLEPVDIVNHCCTERDQRDVRFPLLLISHAKELIVSKMTL